MSEDTEAESTNTSEIINDSKNNIIPSENTDIKELLKIPFIKDLQIKLEVLKNGIITERKKNKIMETQIKQLEGEITSKTEQIKNLSKEKLEIENQLALEKKQLEKKEEDLQKMVSVLNSSNKNNLNQNKENNDNINEKKQVSLMANEEVKKLNEEITQLKFENETFLKKLNMSLEENENRKMEFKTLNKALTDKIKSLGEEINKLKQEKIELVNNINSNSSRNEESLKEKEHFEALLNEYKKSKDEAMHQLDACLEKCSRLMEENQNYKDSLHIHQEEAAKVAEKLTKYKNMIDKVNLRNQMYHVTKIGSVSNHDIDIYFGLDKNGNYVMRIDDKKNVDYINIQDVEYVIKVEKSKNKVQISYMNNSKKFQIYVLVDEFVIEEFIEAYKNFYTESLKIQNELRF